MWPNVKSEASVTQQSLERIKSFRAAEAPLPSPGVISVYKTRTKTTIVP
jgi:hypothetical protein